MSKVPFFLLKVQLVKVSTHIYVISLNKIDETKYKEKCAHLQVYAWFTFILAKQAIKYFLR